MVDKIPHGTEFESSYSAKDGVKVTFFNSTPAIASYLYAFINGPFV